MIMFLQFVGSINCKRKKSCSVTSINSKRKCYGGIILNLSIVIAKMLWWNYTR